ncbi:phosphoribosylglycinamide formyltransferase [Brevundimonas sp.]|uniref:phosphoribosylglycinamide formyltransferase n=1 Tax=Brevundimonas sp. TaxID=1871086 RepID=UPI00391DF505
MSGCGHDPAPPPAKDGKTRVAILISGAGSNMAALLEAAKAADYPAEIAVVISNNPEAAGLELARRAGIEALAIDHRPFGKVRHDHELALDAAMRLRGVEVVVLAGYMRILTAHLVRAWEGRMLNIHPSLLPNYPGLDTHARAIAAGDAEAGCTVHLVTEGVDEGPVLGQARVPIEPGDTAETLAARVRTAEHKLYPEALAAFIEQRKTAPV